MLRAHIPAVQPARPAPAFTEAQALAADMVVHDAKVSDPYGQRNADQISKLEMRLREATGRVA